MRPRHEVTSGPESICRSAGVKISEAGETVAGAAVVAEGACRNGACDCFLV